MDPALRPALYPAPPPPGLKRTLWRWRIKLDVTFALSVMYPGEKLFVWTLFGLVLASVLVASYTYLPAHILHTASRLAYYLYGDSPELRLEGPLASVHSVAVGSHRVPIQ